MNKRNLSARNAAAIKQARAQYCNDDIEIDDKPKLSHVVNAGIWVAAWVWVSHEEIDATLDAGESK